MNKEYELDENGNVIDKTTVGDVLKALKGMGPNKKTSKPEEDEQPLGKAMLIFDMPRTCYGCPCCDGEQGYCTVLPDGPDGTFYDRLDNCPIKQITITPEEFTKRIKNIQELYSSRYDTEERHVAMDGLMCELLRDLGYGEGADIFEKTTKWYA